MLSTFPVISCDRVLKKYLGKLVPTDPSSFLSGARLGQPVVAGPWQLPASTEDISIEVAPPPPNLDGLRALLEKFLIPYGSGNLPAGTATMEGLLFAEKDASTRGHLAIDDSAWPSSFNDDTTTATEISSSSLFYSYAEKVSPSSPSSPLSPAASSCSTPVPRRRERFLRQLLGWLCLLYHPDC
ncbi:hypothetical protein FZEAL_7908 [Fusarium zealandicum]|uniref:Uncharacterized protein n=1 Tax=Fusarium zealandicum TaxID=1053134 RepID=A0A8H4UF29_9HYPO|nr:hypothetical protein FZEAL_7908 [Fusarium zealandicum]